MINKRGKKAQIQISFSMIFSIILIVVFIAVAVYGIVKFLGIQECAETGLFKQDLQTSIDKAWSSDSSYEIFPKNNPITLPKKIDYICFIDLGKESKGSHSDYYLSFKSEGLTNHNMFFSPITEACSGQGSFEIKHINIEKITENENPYCIANDKIEMKIEKAFGENLVRIKKSTDLTNTDESSGNSGGSSSGSSATWKSTKTVSNQEFIAGAGEIAAEEERFKIEVNGGIHYVGVVEVTDTTATIEVFSTLQKAVLLIGQIKKFDVTEDDFYDIQITLNNITNKKADITIKKIYERINEGNKSCVDKCGDGVCAGVVCLAIGCPCAETHGSCPQDCP